MLIPEADGRLAALALSSGTSGVFYSIINLAQAGDNIVSARNLYGGSYTQFNDILPALGIEVRFVDSQDPDEFARAADENTRAFFTETVSNPALEVADLEAISRHAKACGVPLIVDSTFSTPYLTRPIEHGADIVVHSLTKWFIQENGKHAVYCGNFRLPDFPSLEKAYSRQQITRFKFRKTHRAIKTIEGIGI